MTKGVKISVIVPTYRRKEELKRALDSLAEQSMHDLEIILVDDNDDTLWNEYVNNIVTNFRKEHTTVNLQYIVNRQNLGSAASRNAGISAAQGTYITFLDDDDFYLPDKIKYQYEFMTKNNLDYSITDLALFYDNGKICEIRQRKFLKKFDKESLLRYHMMHHLTGTDTMMFTKAYLNKIGAFAQIDVGDEFYLMEKAIQGGGIFGYLQRCDVKAFVHKGECGLSSGLRKINGENDLFEYKKRYFSTFDKRAIKYIITRHHGVLAFAYMRQKKLKNFVKEAILSFSASPIDCLRLLFLR